jgi:hypothetical protein
VEGNLLTAQIYAGKIANLTNKIIEIYRKENGDLVWVDRKYPSSYAS